MVMLHIDTALSGMDDLQACSFLQTNSFKLSINKSGEKGIATAHKYMQQLHDIDVLELISSQKKTKIEIKRAMENLILLNKKREENNKARMCTNGSTQ